MRTTTCPYRVLKGVKTGNEEGSLLIMVLLVLLILTAVALSLMFVTELEMRMGGSERVITHTYYAAESGLHAAVAGLKLQNWAPTEFAFVEGPLGPNQLIGTRVKTSNIDLLGPGQLPPMTLANEGENEYYSYSVYLTSKAQRVAWPNSDPVPIYPPGSSKENFVTIQSERVLSTMFLVSPMKEPESPRGADITGSGGGGPYAKSEDEVIRN